jgi:hypothetical protein
MRGFQPGKARAVPQNYADGGVVSTIKGMLGFGKKKSEPLPADLNKMPPTGAGPAASQPEPPKKAISQYSGMSALERRMKEQGLADGGLVRGPGTGISDDIEDEVEEGTFIMPADSTEAIGPEVMERAGKAVPVRLSNGEAKLPPEALQAIGAQVMEAIKDVTHVPAAKQARGFPMGEHVGSELDDDGGRMNFADGGVAGEKRLYLADAGLATQERLKREGMTIAERARQPAFSVGAGTYTPKPAAQVAPAAPRPAAAPATSIAARVTPQSGGASGSWEAKQNPAQPTMPTDVRGWRTKAVIDGAAEDAQAAWDRGSPMAAAGSVIRGAVTAVPTAVMDVGRDVVDLVSGPVGNFYDGLTGNTSAPASAKVAASQPVAPKTVAPTSAEPAASPATTQPKPEAPKPNTDPQKPAANPNVREISPGIYRQGNSYGDSPEAAATGARPSQGPSEYNQAVATALEARDRGMPVPEVSPTLNGAPGSRRTISSAVSGGGASPVSPASPASASSATASRGLPSSGQQPDVMGIYARASEALKGVAEAQRALDGNQAPGGGGTYIKHSGNDWETEKNLKNLRTSASSIFNKRGPRGAPSVEEMAYMKALDADFAARNGNNPAAIEAMRQQGETGRAGMREAGENARSGRRDGIAAELGRGQLDLQRSAQGFTTRQAERQERLYAEYDAAKTPEERATIAQKIRDLSGKVSDPKDNFMVVGGGQEWDEKAGAMRNVPQRLIDLRTGQDVGDTGAVRPLPIPKTQDQLKVGQVYDTQRGPAKWDGKQFIAVVG